MTDEEFDEYLDGIEAGEDDDEEVMEYDVISPALKKKLRNLVEKREKRDAAKLAWQKEKDECETLELEVFDIFERPGADGEPQIKGTLTVPLGEPYGDVKFRTRETHYAKIIDDEEVQKHYEKRAMMEEVSAPKFVMKRLNDDVREALESDVDLPKGLSYTTQRGMTITLEK